MRREMEVSARSLPAAMSADDADFEVEKLSSHPRPQIRARTPHATLLLGVNDKIVYLNLHSLLLAPYCQYIRDFKWESLRFPTKRSLNELTIQI